MRRLLPVGLALAPAATSAAFAFDGRARSWELSATGSTARLRGLSVVNENVVWTSGSLGTVLTATDGGQSRQAGVSG